MATSHPKRHKTREQILRTHYDACPDCGGIKAKPSRRCRKCKDKVWRGDQHNCWKGGEYTTCVKCGGKAHRRSKTGLCRLCMIAQWKDTENHRHHSWKGGRPICEDCGNRLKASTGKRCIKCEAVRKRGEGNPRWAGGKSFESYPAEFCRELKERIRARDGHVCQYCVRPQNGELLHVHHIDYDKRNVSEENLVSLCRPCHLRTNANRAAWQRFFTEMISERGLAAA
jgi:hypothetical protein